jgi:hypothetical protein
MKGYSVDAGYMGYLPKYKRYFLFPTEGEYIDAFMNEKEKL